MPQIAITSTFWEGVDRLDKPARARVHKAMAKFQAMTVPQLHADKGLHLESVVSSRDPRMRTIRVDDNLRIVLLAPDDGSDLFVLVHVVPHDKAYAWARRRLYTVNTVTRCLEVRDLTAMEQITPMFEKEAAAAPTFLFAPWSDTLLRDLGVDEVTLRAARTITGKGQLEAFGSLMPEDQFEALWLLAEGYEPADIYRDLVAPRQKEAADAGETGDDLAAAVTRTRSRIALVTGPDELEDILAKPFDAWRIFLHPTQRRIAYRPSYAGPAQITGGPGTGKTVVALHRVKHLLGRAPHSRILLTTYTGALARSLRAGLALLLDHDEELLARVDVTTVDAVATRTVRKVRDNPGRPLSGKDERTRWNRLARRRGLPWNGAFLAQEYRHVILAQNLRDEDTYLACERHGRGSALRRAQRSQVWQAVAEFEADLKSERAHTWLQLCAEATRLLADEGRAGTAAYDHVVVDEAQDLHPAQWRLLRALVPAGPDDLFITGDPHQRIYDSRVSLRSLGIPVTGRSGRLRINYRSTEEILRWSRALLDGAPVTDLAGDGDDTLAGYRSLLHGASPSCTGHEGEAAEADAVVARVQDWLDAGVAAADIAVCARFNNLMDKLAERLERARIPVVRVRDGEQQGAAGVRLSTLHSMKGLEYRCVAVAGVTAGAFPFAPAVTDATVDHLQHATDLAAERCLLFVACTRAREALSVTYHGAPSEFLGR
ncbi:UvrD-helicase domain-containing protein [Streptomyces sp. NPDC001661]